ncbi:ion channel [Roseobacter sp.]|uniref:ion channel n=1 Tax=Roseobacter sp. TaxID=1907202 RepID=UPI00385E57D4
MNVLFQIVLGSSLLIACAFIHIFIISRIILKLQLANHFSTDQSAKHQIFVVAALFTVLIGSHTLQIYVWAIMLWLIGALPGYEEPIYFTLVTYTALGYGDVVLTPAFRIFGAMISVTGLVMFGMTTAFLVGIFSRILHEKNMDEKQSQVNKKH